MFKFFANIKYRIIFIFRYKTFRAIQVINNKTIAVSCSKGIYLVNRRCQHLGAYLDQAFKNDNVIICNWHGCRINVDSIGSKK